MSRSWLTQDLPGSGGLLRPDPSDFIVHEILPFLPEGQGAHLFVEIEKIGLTTLEALARLEAAAGVSERAAGYAGMKDRSAVARQWISLEIPPSGEAGLASAEGDGLRILEMARHPKKLRRGQQRGNRFAITIREVPEGGFGRAARTLSALSRSGVPNTFGPQRFGRDGKNVELALEFVLHGRRPPRSRRMRDLLVSALQAEIFNRVLADRLASGRFDRALEGDVMQKHDTGGLFDVTDPGREQPRVDRLEISPTGPLPGRRARVAAGEAGRIEAAALHALGLAPNALDRHAPGTRRALRYPLGDDARLVELEPDAFRLEVTLPSGAYASVLLDEIVKPADGPFSR